MVEARYFDGRTSRAHAVRLGVAGARLRIVGDGFERLVPLEEIAASEPGAARLRTLSFRSGGSCEAEDAALRALLDAIGHHDSAVARGQLRWSVAFGAGVALAAGVVAAYLALPWAAERVARWLPEAALVRIGDETLALLDRAHFEPSALAAERQDALRTRFEAVAAGDALPAHRISFRAAPAIGPNAFALPNGELIVTDELVALAEHDDQIVAVLAHEVGHLDERHALRSALHRSAVAAVVAVYLGDLSSLGAGVSTFLLQAKYSRDFEREADAWAKAFLQRHAIDPGALAQILERMESAAGEKPDGGSAFAYLATHPVTAERIRLLTEP